MKSEKGFSLLEVVASLVILSIVLLSFIPFFINSKTMSQSNMERLVVINLADATMERLKIDPYSYIEKPKGSTTYLSHNNGTRSYSSTSCINIAGKEPCKSNYEVLINGNKYSIEIKASQTSKENELKLIEIVATVKNANGKIKYPVEGYISYE